MGDPRDLSCVHLVELVTDYLEGALSRRDRLRIEAHLEECPDCVAYLDQIRVTIAASGRLRAEWLDPEVKDALVQAFRGWRGESPA
ncbi:MAG TPA: zf-HC2 domain-containing protein [Gaiellaceae bacterium]|jgi:anti-sigma factor RsiW